MKIFVRLGIFFAFCVGLFAFRHYLIGTALELAISRITGETIVYRSRTWEEGRLVYHGFGLGDQFQAEKASFECNFHLFPLSVEPRIRFIKPLIQLEEDNSSSLQLAFLVPSKYLAMKLDILGGSLMTREGALYPFEFSSGLSREEIGTLQLQDLLTCSLYLHENKPAFNLEIQDSPLEKLFPLASQFYPIKKLEGILTTQLQGKIGSQFLTSLQGRCGIKNFHFESEELILALDDLASHIDFEEDIKTLILNADFRGADFFWKELEILRAHGSVVFKPSEKPFFEIHGGVHLKSLEGQADIIGHGEVHPGGPVWLQGKMDYVTQSTPMSIDFSWVDQGVFQVLQTDFHNLSYEILEMFLPVKSGVVDAKLTTFFDHFVYQKTEVSDLRAQDLNIDQLSVYQIEAQGLVNLLTKNVESLNLQVQELQGKYEGWNLSSLYASIKMMNNVFEPSSAFGKIENIPVSLEFQGPVSRIHATAKLAAGASEWLQLPKNPAEPPILADLSLDIANPQLNFTGKLTCLDDYIDLKASANLAEKKWTGSFQGMLFSSYVPFLKITFPEVKLRGEVGVKGVFSNEKLEAILQGHEMTLEALGMKASLAGQSREVKVHFDFAQKTFNMEGELSSMVLSQDQMYTSIEGGEFSFSNHLLTCRNLCGQFFLHNYQTDFIGDLAYDTSSHQLNMDHIEGTLTAPMGERIDFRSEHIQHLGSDWNFDAAFFQNSQTLLTLQGSGKEFSHGCDFVLKEATAAGSYLKTSLSVRWHLGKIERAQGALFLQIDKLAHQLLLLDRFGVFKFSKDAEDLFQQLQGNLFLHIDHHTSHADYVLEGTNLSYDTSPIESIQARLRHEGDVWMLTHFQLDGVKCQGKAVQHGDKWIISTFDVQWKDLSLNTTGRFEEKKLHFDVTGNWKRQYTLLGHGIFAARQLTDLSLKLSDEQELLAELALDQLSYRMDKWESPAAKLSLFSKHFSQPVQSTLILSLSRRGCIFQGPFSKGSATIGKSELKLGQLFALYEAPHFYFKCTATLDEEPLQFIGKFSDQHWEGGVHIQQGSDLLKLTFSDPTTVQKAEGELFGITLNLAHKNPGFEGIVTLKEGDKLSKLLDNETWKEFSGLQLKGLFGLEGSFKGEIEGQGACLKDYLVAAVSAKVDYTSRQFKLRDFLLQDAAGVVNIKECLGARASSQDEWMIAIPFLKGQEIKPSLLRKRRRPTSEPKPFQIRQLALFDIKGKLTDLSSFKTQGTLFFTQRVKKESSLFNIPYALMKDLGLDLDLFTPVMGEIRVALKEGKLFFTQMQNTFSEGKRSEFSLANEPSFIDLNGRLFLNFRMRQNATLKLAEPFMISVRGTWEKPKYSLN